MKGGRTQPRAVNLLPPIHVTLYFDRYCEQGMVSGKRQAVDSALVKANASVDSMTRDVIMPDTTHYCRQVAKDNCEEDESTANSKPPLFQSKS